MNAPARPTLGLMLSHPAHLLALGFGSGLAPTAPGTVGTLAAWGAFVLIRPHFSDPGFALLLLVSLGAGVLACTRTARALGRADPGAIVWDEWVAFWLVLWLTPGAWAWQAVAFALFRFFDAAKPGPVGWADQLHKPEVAGVGGIGWRQGWGILFDDLVAAACTLGVLAPLTLAWTKIAA